MNTCKGKRNLWRGAITINNIKLISRALEKENEINALSNNQKKH